MEAAPAKGAMCEGREERRGVAWEFGDVVVEVETGAGAGVVDYYQYYYWDFVLRLAAAMRGATTQQRNQTAAPPDEAIQTWRDRCTDGRRKEGPTDGRMDGWTDDERIDERRRGTDESLGLRPLSCNL